MAAAITFDKNNLLIYYAPLSSIGGVDDNVAAAGIVSVYDYVVIAPHDVGDLPNLVDILTMVKQIKPKCKIFGYTALGSATDMDEWQASVDQWQTDLSASLLDGIFIDEFDFDWPLSTRPNQNTAVDYVHAATLSAFINSYKLTDGFESETTGMVGPTIGLSVDIRDYALLESVFYVNTTYNAPEGKSKLLGRLKYVKGLIEQTFPVKLNVGFMAAVGMGDANTLVEADYLYILKTLPTYKIEGLSLAPTDYGATSEKYFIKNTALDFDQAGS